MAEKTIPVGGQAVIEGVLMKSPNHVVMSARLEDGSIVSKHEQLRKRPKWAEIFFIRGVYNLVEMLIIGVKSLTWSSNQALKNEEGKQEESISTKDIILVLIASFALVLLFFVALPYFFTILTGVREEKAPFLFNLIDGVIKTALFLAYVWAISNMEDVKRLFSYHGAEHKAVHCYENGEELTVKNCKKYSTIHSRCGSSFLMLVVVISILILSIIPSLVIWLHPSFLTLSFWKQKAILFPLRILAIPIITGISYELLKYADKHQKNPIMKLVSYPGALLQKMTTKQPDDKMIEVAIVTLKTALELEEKHKAS